MENPEFLQCNNPQFSPEKPLAGDNFAVEDLLDFPNDDENDTFDTVAVTSAGDTTVTAVDSCNSSFSGGEPHFSGDVGCRNLADSQFSGDLCVLHEDLAELEWLSNFVEESFSSEDLHKMQLISGMKARTQEASDKIRTTRVFDSEMSVPAKARSKRSRTAPCKWTSRLLVLSPPTTITTTTISSELDSDTSSTGKKTIKVSLKKKESTEIATNRNNGGYGGRRCLHCATDKTPQWRTGPFGPKTLCNACGVRYKSGRLVQEYRPASSPTFVLTKHSNSHRKVLELRRQKELQEAHQQHFRQFLHQNMMFDLSNGEDYLIHQHIGPDYQQLI